MTDRERLVTLLGDLFPPASRSAWPFTVEQAADALIAAGVTLAATEKPVVRVLGLTMDQLRAAVATADQYHPQWRSLQNARSSQGE